MMKEKNRGRRVFLYGASGHAKVVIDVLRSNEFNSFGLIDDNPSIKQLLDIPVYMDVESGGFGREDLLIITVGDNQIRKEIAGRFVGFDFPVAVHSHAYVSKEVTVGEGTVVMANATVNVDSSIGRHCIINTNASVDHECVLEDFVHISPNVALAGNVTVGEGTQVGIGATVIQNVNIGKWAMIGAGAVVIRDVPDYAVVVGNPGRVIKFREPVSLKETLAK